LGQVPGHARYSPAQGPPHKRGYPIRGTAQQREVLRQGE
jgi:hypothetical protein